MSKGPSTSKVLDHFDWVVREDQEGHVVIRMSGGGRIRITNNDAEALLAGLQHLKDGGTVHLNRRAV